MGARPRYFYNQISDIFTLWKCQVHIKYLITNERKNIEGTKKINSIFLLYVKSDFNFQFILEEPAKTELWEYIFTRWGIRQIWLRLHLR